MSNNNIKQRGLGRDLEALLGKRRLPETAPATGTTNVTLPIMLVKISGMLTGSNRSC